MNIYFKPYAQKVTGRIFILNIIAAMLSSLIYSGDLYSQPLQERVEEFNLRNYREEINVHTDRDIYVTGEQVWLKVYIMNGLSHIPGGISKVAYIELLDRNNLPVKQIKVNIDGASASSVFTLPDNLNTGNYILRAYTKWMENFSTDLFFSKVISVINPFESIEHFALPPKNRVADSVVLFPEGGSIITGQKNTVAIRSFDRESIPVEMTGVVVKNGRDTICTVTTKNNGFGTVEIIPRKNEKYSLLYKGPGGIKEEVFPGIRESSVGLRVIYSKDNKSFTVKILNGSEVASVKGKYNFIIFSAGVISSLRQINIGTDSILKIQASDFPFGLSQFLLTDEKGNQIAGRYIYNEYDDRIKLNITLQKTEYSNREKVKVNVNATDIFGKPVEADLTVSVTKTVVANSGSKNNDDAVEINNYLISYPSHGLNMRDLMNPEQITYEFLPEAEGHQISGHMIMKSTDEPIRNTDISLSFVGKTSRCLFGRTDINGEFRFIIKEPGLSEIVIQSISPDVTGYYTELYQPFCNESGNLKPQPFYLDSNRISALNNVIISMQINNIYEPLRETGSETQNSIIPDFYGTPENTVKMSDYIELSTLREVVKEILPNVNTVKQNGKYDFRLISKFRGQPFTNIPLILVDGVPIYDFEKVLSINSKEIERADIINTRYFFSEYIFDGIVSFISGKGDLSVLEFDNSIFRQVYEGCQITGNFHPPDYSSDYLQKSRTPDFRNTLFWGPDLHTGKDGKTEFEFYTSDESMDYIINVEGITSEGKKGTVNFPLITGSKQSGSDGH